MFLMYAMLFGVFAAVVPIVIHLLHRQRSTPVQWGAMQFLQDTSIKQRRRKNIDHWLLMLLRMLMLACMAVLLARPILKTGAYNPFASTVSSDIAVVIDHSLSMGRRSGDRTLFDHSVDVVDKIVSSLHPTDTLSVVLADHAPRSFTEHPISNAASNSKEQLAQLRQSLRQERAGMESCSIAAAVQMAREQLSTGRNVRKVIIILSDQQRSNWQQGNDAPWRAALSDRNLKPEGDLSVYAIAIPPGGVVSSSANLSISNLTISPALIGVNRMFAVTARVSNSGPGDLAGGAPIQLTVDGKFAAGVPVKALTAGESATVRFEPILTEAGSHWLKVSTDFVDGLEADNAAYAVLDVINRLPVLVVDGDVSGVEGFRASRFLATALMPNEPGVGGALVDARIIDPSNVGREVLDPYGVVILNDVPRLSAEATSKLVEYVQAGHGLWIILGPRSDTKTLADTLGKTPLFPMIVKSQQILKGNDFATIDVKEPEHPALAELTAAERNAFTGSNITGWWEVTPAADAAVNTLLTVNHLDANMPLMLAHDVGGSGGRVVVWTSNVDSTWNNLPLVPNFLPLVQETILHLSAGLMKGKDLRLEAGQTKNWTADGATPVEEVTITTPTGLQQKLSPIGTNGKYVVAYKETQTPGLYVMRFLPEKVPQPVYFTVNIDPAELDPATLTDTDLDWFKSHYYLTDRITVEGLDRATATANRGAEMWPWTVVLLLFLIIAEAAMAWHAARLQEGAGVT